MNDARSVDVWRVVGSLGILAILCVLIWHHRSLEHQILKQDLRSSYELRTTAMTMPGRGRGPRMFSSVMLAVVDSTTSLAHSIETMTRQVKTITTRKRMPRQPGTVTKTTKRSR